MQSALKGRPMPRTDALPPGVSQLRAPARSAATDTGQIAPLVAEILAAVRDRGDAAVADYALRFDNSTLAAFEVTAAEREQTLADLDPQTRADTEFAIANVRRFAQAQLATILPLDTQSLPGVHMGHRVIPLETVGCYVPGGRYPLLSAPIMTIVPAKVAGVDTVIACLPPNAHPAMIAGCHLSGADRIFRIGGAQAIAAMAYGTETVPAVAKIVGPGNAFVNEAKAAGLRPGRHRPACRPVRDLHPRRPHRRRRDDRDRPARAGRARHPHPRRPDHHRRRPRRRRRGRGDAPAHRPRHRRNRRSRLARLRRDCRLRQRGGDDRLLRPDRRRAPASPHRRPARLCQTLRNYGSLFIGELASVVYSDKCSGTNHTLPTMAAGRYTGGLWVGAYVKIATHQWLTPEGVNLVAPPAVRQSTSEGLDGHRRAAQLRLDRLQAGS
jgi:sulfopropanediol 3-dehydrogenase